jgi:hypothetical protein
MSIDFEPLDLNSIQKEVKRINSGEGAENEFMQQYVRMPERDGFVLLRFLPRKKGQQFFCATRIHTLKNPATGKMTQYHCPRDLSKDANGKEAWRGDCIICSLYHSLWQKSERLNGKDQENMQNQARELKPLERYYYNVIVRSESDGKGGTLKNVGPKIYSCGKQVHSKIMLAINGDQVTGEKELGDITRPDTGCDFRLVKKVVKSGAREYPNYDNSRFEDPSVAGTQEEMAKWFGNLIDLAMLRKLKSADELKHALRVHCGMVVEEDNNDLNEFYGQAVREPAKSAGSTLAAGADKIREEDIAPKQSPSKTKQVEEDSMADEDFLKELGAI